MYLQRREIILSQEEFLVEQSGTLPDEVYLHNIGHRVCFSISHEHHACSRCQPGKMEGLLDRFTRAKFLATPLSGQ